MYFKLIEKNKETVRHRRVPFLILLLIFPKLRCKL